MWMHESGHTGQSRCHGVCSGHRSSALAYTVLFGYLVTGPLLLDGGRDFNVISVRCREVHFLLLFVAFPFPGCS